MTVWVFGDSFSLTTSTPHAGQWMHQIGAKFRTETRCYGLHGSSLEFTYYRFNLVRNEMKFNDIVIINLTRSNRHWFFKNFPAHHGNESPTNNHNDVIAMESYRELLDKNLEIPTIHLLNFLYNLHGITKKLGLKTILLCNTNEEYNLLIEKRNQFPLFTVAKGMLRDLSINEYKKDSQYLLSETKTIGAFDPRMNHLIRSNHNNLANKIINNLVYQTPIDLTQDIVSDLITKELLEDKEFIEYELFNNWTKVFENMDLNDIGSINSLFL